MIQIDEIQSLKTQCSIGGPKDLSNKHGKMLYITPLKIPNLKVFIYSNEDSPPADL